MRQVRVAVAALLVLATSATSGAAPAIPGSRAADHVGNEVTIEGRVVATHASPLATILAFAPNFAGFTATVLAADRDKFPSDLEQRYRNKLVRVTGMVTSYRGKPEMRLREPAQLEMVDAPAPTATPLPVAAAPSPAVDADETAQALATIAARLDALDARLTGVERGLAAMAGAAPASLAIGLPAAQVRTLLGEPRQIVPGPRAEPVWVYDAGRTVTFDRAGRVVSWTGF